MFVIQKFISDYHERMSAWEEARDKWVNDDNYGYRSRDGYEHKHPKPYSVLVFMLKLLSIVIPIILLLGFMLFMIFQPDDPNSKPKPKEEVKAVTYKNGQDCGKYHIGDVGKIDYGDYEGAEVKIIGGCDNGDPYEVEVTRDQTLFAPGSKDEQLDDQYIKAGLTLKVNSSDNLTITAHSKN